MKSITMRPRTTTGMTTRTSLATIIAVCVFMVTAVVFLFLLITSDSYKESFEKEPFADTRYLEVPTKCFSCERQLPDGYKWLGQNTKCFSCERQMLEMNPNNPESVYYEHPNKCFSCERKS